MQSAQFQLRLPLAQLRLERRSFLLTPIMSSWLAVLTLCSAMPRKKFRHMPQTPIKQQVCLQTSIWNSQRAFPQVLSARWVVIQRRRQNTLTKLLLTWPTTLIRWVRAWSPFRTLIAASRWATTLCLITSSSATVVHRTKCRDYLTMQESSPEQSSIFLPTLTSPKQSTLSRLRWVLPEQQQKRRQLPSAVLWQVQNLLSVIWLPDLAMQTQT